MIGLTITRDPMLACPLVCLLTRWDKLRDELFTERRIMGHDRKQKGGIWKCLSKRQLKMKSTILEGVKCASRRVIIF